MPKHPKTTTLLIIALLLLVSSWLVLRDNAAWVDEVLLTEYPLRVAFAEGLADSRLPLWTPGVLGGYPQLAAGATGALYPPNLILHLLTPAPVALTLFLVAHLFWAALGTFVYANHRLVSRSAATGAALVFLSSGFLTSAMRRPNLVACIAWLPWQFLLADLVLRPGPSLRRNHSAALFALISGMTFLTGLPSAAMMGTVTTVFYALCLLIARRTHVRAFLLLALSSCTGVLLASAQLLPGLELACMSAQVPPGQPGGLAACLPVAVSYLLPSHWHGPFALGIAILAGFGWKQVAIGSATRGTRIAAGLATLGLIALGLNANLCELAAGSGWLDSMASLQATPDSAAFLRANCGIYRIIGEVGEPASRSRATESLQSTLPLLYGLFAANASAPSIPYHYAHYMADLTPQKLNLLGVKYILVPLDPMGSAEPDNSFRDVFMYDPLDNVMPTPLVMASSVEIEWYLSDSADWENQAPVALLTFMTEETVDIMEYTLTAGSHTADWAYERSDMRDRVKHDRTIVSRTFAARSSSPPQSFAGQVYKTNIKLPYAVLIHGVKIESLADPEHVHMERVTLVDQEGERYLFSHMAGLSDHTLAYRSDEVAIYENHDVLPRAFLAYDVRQPSSDTEADALLRSPAFDPRQQIVLTEARTAAVTKPRSGTERVELETYASSRVIVQVQAPADGYLVLTDTWYPGWRAFVDGTEVTVLRADLAFRAVFVPEGEHRVSFMYDPVSFRVGIAVSSLALALWLSWWLLSTRSTARQAP